MNKLTGAIMAGLALAALTTPADAQPRPDNNRHDRYDRRADNRHDNNRPGWQNDRNRPPSVRPGQIMRDSQRQAYVNGQRADDRRYDNRYNNRPNNGYYNNGAYAGGYYDNRGYSGYRGPVYNNANYRNANPYWWGPNGQMYCRRNDGTTGTIIGALAGGTLGNLVAGYGDKTLGSVIGGTLGAVLGSEISKGNARCR